MQLPQVLDAIQLGHATFNKIRQNLWWAFGYNLVGIPLAAGALLPSMGIALTPSISGTVNPPLLLHFFHSAAAVFGGLFETCQTTAVHSTKPHTSLFFAVHEL